MNRRAFIALLGGAAVAWPLAARAQPQPKMLRVGLASVQPRTTAIYVAFIQRMAELGYEEGKNFIFDYVQVPNVDAYESGYRELVSRNIDLLIASGPEITLKSALAVAGSLPIVMVAVDYDPFARGYVTSLARPTGNLTGIFFQQIELTAKRLQLMKEAFPDLQSVTVFWDEVSADQWRAAQTAAPALGLRLLGATRVHHGPWRRGSLAAGGGRAGKACAHRQVHRRAAPLRRWLPSRPERAWMGRRRKPYDRAYLRRRPS